MTDQRNGSGCSHLLLSQHICLPGCPRGSQGSNPRSRGVSDCAAMAAPPKRTQNPETASEKFPAFTIKAKKTWICKSSKLKHARDSIKTKKPHVTAGDQRLTIFSDPPHILTCSQWAVESKTLLSGYFEKHSQGLSQKLLSAYSDFSAEPITWRSDGLPKTLENSSAACRSPPATAPLLIEAELL